MELIDINMTRSPCFFEDICTRKKWCLPRCW